MSKLLETPSEIRGYTYREYLVRVKVPGFPGCVVVVCDCLRERILLPIFAEGLIIIRHKEPSLTLRNAFAHPFANCAKSILVPLLSVNRLQGGPLSSLQYVGRGSIDLCTSASWHHTCVHTCSSRLAIRIARWQPVSACAGPKLYVHGCKAKCRQKS